MTGIYEIWIGDKFYQGRSNNIEKRTKAHLYMLKNRKHNNTHMQNAYNKYGTFEWHTLIECDDEAAIMSWEQSFIDTNFGLSNCMNCSPFNGGGWAPEWLEASISSKKGKPRSEETKQKLREANKGRTAFNKGKNFVNGKYV
jgi:group I intron endonuclease